ncbi:unnamed protein product [Brassica oleracea]
MLLLLKKSYLLRVSALLKSHNLLYSSLLKLDFPV